MGSPHGLPDHALHEQTPEFGAAIPASHGIKVIMTLFTEHNHGPTVIDNRNPAIKVLLKRTAITRCVVDGRTGVNVISKAT